MNRIVRERYPTAKLPEDLRKGLDPHASWVRVSVKPESPTERCEPLTLEKVFALGRTGPSRTADEIDADVAALRDEWRIRE